MNFLHKFSLNKTRKILILLFKKEGNVFLFWIMFANQFNPFPSNLHFYSAKVISRQHVICLLCICQKETQICCLSAERPRRWWKNEIDTGFSWLRNERICEWVDELLRRIIWVCTLFIRFFLSISFFPNIYCQNCLRNSNFCNQINI